MAVDGEAFGDVGLGEGFLHVADAVGEAAALVGGEGNAIQEKNVSLQSINLQNITK